MPIVALLPADPGALAVTGSDTARTGDLHVTLLYLGEDPYQADDVQTVGQIVADAVQAVGVASISADVSGVGTLGDDHAVVLTLESETLCALRHAIAEGCEEAGFEDASGHPGWIAHLTVGYPPSTGPEGTTPDVTPNAQPAAPVVDLFQQALAFQGTEIVFDRVAVLEGDQSLWEQSLDAEPPPQEAPMADPAAPVPGTTYAPVAPAVKAPPSKTPPPAKAPMPKGAAAPADQAAPTDQPASVPSGPNTVLVGMAVADPTAITTQVDGTLPYMTVDTPPYLAMFELKLDATHTADDVAAILAPVDPGSTDSTVTSAVSASNPLRRAVLVDPAPFQDSYDTIRQALTDAGFTAADYPLAVQLGTVDKATAAGLKGTALTFDGLIVVGFDGAVTTVSSDTTSSDTNPATAADGAGPPAAVNDGSAVVGSGPKITLNTEALDQALASIKQQLVAAVTPGVDSVSTGATIARGEGVLVVFGVDSGDGRVIAPGSLTWRKLPLPLWLKTDQSGDGHDGAELAGRIETIEDRGADLWATFSLDLGSEAGREMQRLMTVDENGLNWLRGVSVDLDTVGGEMMEDPMWDDFYGGKLTVTRGRVLGATACVAPALEDASLTLLASALANLGLSGEGCDCDREVAMVAAAGPAMPGAQMRVWTPWNRQHGSLVATGQLSRTPFVNCYQCSSSVPTAVRILERIGVDTASLATKSGWQTELSLPLDALTATLNSLDSLFGVRPVPQSAIGRWASLHADGKSATQVQMNSNSSERSSKPPTTGGAQPAGASGSNTPPDSANSTKSTSTPTISTLSTSTRGASAPSANAPSSSPPTRNSEPSSQLISTTITQLASLVAGCAVHATADSAASLTILPAWKELPPTSALVASGTPRIPVNPPLAWFEHRQYESATPLTIDAEGRVYGHVAGFGQCHIGFSDRCVAVPRSMSNYRYFANKQTLTAEGTMVSTGPIMMDTVHPDLRKLASDAQAFYAHTGCAFADVVLYEDEFGIAMAGAVRPDVTPEQLRAARGSDISPDWRSIKGQYELVALLSVNASGFITPALAASAAEAGERAVEPGKFAIGIDFETGELLSLVAAGMVRHESTVVDWQSKFEAMCADFTELRQAVLPIVSESLSARQRAAAQRGGFRDVNARFEAMRARFVHEQPEPVQEAEVA